MNLMIRPAGLSDLDALVALIGGFRNHLGAKLPTDAEIRRDLPRALNDTGLEFSCAWIDRAPVGYAQVRFFMSVWVGGTEAHLDDLFVVSAARGQGVGRSLLRHTIARSEARGALRFGLNTNERNEAGQSLYRSEGMAPQSHALYPGGREVFWVKELGRDPRVRN